MRFRVGLPLPFAAALATVAAVSFSAFAHGELNWAAEFRNVRGTQCCVGSHDNTTGDCIVVEPEIGRVLKMDSVIVLRFASGWEEVQINAIHPMQDGRFVVCKPGCLFTEAGV